MDPSMASSCAAIAKAAPDGSEREKMRKVHRHEASLSWHCLATLPTAQPSKNWWTQSDPPSTSCALHPESAKPMPSPMRKEWKLMLASITWKRVTRAASGGDGALDTA